MKKIFLLAIIVFSIQVSAMSELYCPTPGEYQDKLSDYQSKLMSSMKSNSYSDSDVSALESLTNDMEKYMKSIVPACVYYFRNPNTNYDCKKLQTLGAGYMTLDKKLQPIAKTKINKLPPQVQQKCSFEYEVLHSIIDKN